jgi:hypothetical protein
MAKLPWNYYKVLDTKATKLFNLDKCEVCECDVLEANSIKGVVKDIPKYKAMGMMEWTGEVPPEAYWSDTHECSACEECVRTDALKSI